MFKKREICIVSVLAAVIAMVAYIYHDDQSYKFDALTDQHKASYCAGVFEYGKSYATDKEQKYTFTKAAEWFDERAKSFGGVKDMSRDRAKTDLEALRISGDQSGFKKICERCADIVLANKK